MAKSKKWKNLRKTIKFSHRKAYSNFEADMEKSLEIVDGKDGTKIIRYRGCISAADGKMVTKEFVRTLRHNVDRWISKYQKKKVEMSSSAWQVGNRGTRFSKIGQQQAEVPPGEYIWVEDHNGVLWAEKQTTKTDNLLNLPDLPTDYILKQIDTFWSKKDAYDGLGMLQKRGILLYGPPGCGKSSIIALLKRQLVEREGVVFGMGEEGYSQLIEGLKQFREVEPERPVMTIVEDMETYMEGSNGSNVAQSEKDALALYDGEHQINRVVHIGTTNKPEVLADRFMKRPGRFDLVIGVWSPTRACREAYLRTIGRGKIAEDKLIEILDATNGLSLAYMREIITTYLILEIPLEDTIKRLRDNAKQKFNGKEGFSVGFDPNQEKK